MQELINWLKKIQSLLLAKYEQRTQTLGVIVVLCSVRLKAQ